MSPPGITSLHPCLVALATATGAVTFLVTRHPAAQLSHLGMQLEVEHSLVVTTPHAERIYSELRLQFADKLSSAWGNQPYFLIDWEDVTHAISEFDAASGQRIRMNDVALGDQVQVELRTAAEPETKQRGEVTAISGQRYLVRFDHPVGDLTGVWASRAHLKPVRRVCAIGAAA